MEANQTWITTGTAARLAARDIRTVRRWADNGIIESRVSPHGRRQIALASLLAAQPAPNRRQSRRPPPPVPDTLADWADTVQDLRRYQPNKAQSNATLEEILLNAREIATGMADIETSILTELRSRDEALLASTSKYR
jgi:hypothetical protein